jgi:hypothetical protein
MADEQPEAKKYSADWFMRGALSRLGDSFDRLTGRSWSPSSSLTSSELIERIKKLLDAEAVEVPGKGTVVPHEIKLKMQWDKFSDDANESLEGLEHELLAAAIDHINDSLYYTYAPVSLEIKPDYFIEGVKLYVSFGEFGTSNESIEMNVTIPSISRKDLPPVRSVPTGVSDTVVVKFTIDGTTHEKLLEFPAGGRRSVGRAASSDLVIDNQSVSKMHASLSISENDTLLVADTGSTNGTFVNGQRIAYGKAVELKTGDILRFGQVEATFDVQPRPVPDPNTETQTADEVVEINGFEFKGRSTSETPNPQAGSDVAGAPETEPVTGNSKSEEIADTSS